MQSRPQFVINHQVCFCAIVAMPSVSWQRARPASKQLVDSIWASFTGLPPCLAAADMMIFTGTTFEVPCRQMCEVEDAILGLPSPASCGYIRKIDAHGVQQAMFPCRKSAWDDLHIFQRHVPPFVLSLALYLLCWFARPDTPSFKPYRYELPLPISTLFK